MQDSVQLKNFSIIPIAAVIHIQKIAPEPPTCKASATPAILPIPIVPPKAVARASQWELVPMPFLLFFWKSRPTACLR